MMSGIIYALIFIILIMISTFIVLVIFRRDIFAKVYKGFTRVSHKSFKRKINLKVTEADLRNIYMNRLAEEEEQPSEFCNEMSLCNKYCKENLCNAYRDQKITYDYCLDCEDKGLCWSDMSNSCEKCKEGGSGCNDRYGCNGEILKNPARNFCKRCWKIN